MRTYVENAWKKKIDPAFDRPVKNYVALLNEIEKSGNEGRLNFPDDFLDGLINNPDWQNITGDSFNVDTLQFIEKTGMINVHSIRNVMNVLSYLKDDNLNGLLRVYPKLVKSLPEEDSRLFYIEEIKRIKENPASRLEDFYPVITSLLIRYLYVMLENAPEKAGQKTDIRRFKQSKSISTFINSVNLIYAQVAFQSFLPLLIMNGDDESIFRAVTINKSILFSEEVKNRFLKAQLQGDSRFFKKLSKAIASNPLERTGQHGKTYSVISMFWYTGLYKLTNDELYYFLVYCGLKPQEDPESFKKFIQRHILPVFKRRLS